MPGLDGFWLLYILAVILSNIIFIITVLLISCRILQISRTLPMMNTVPISARMRSFIIQSDRPAVAFVFTSRAMLIIRCFLELATGCNIMYRVIWNLALQNGMVIVVEERNWMVLECWWIIRNSWRKIVWMW